MSDNKPETVNPNNRDYDNGEIIVHWRPEKCIHCELCHKSLPLVFDPKRRPWVMLSNATTDEIKKAVDQCPSGALSWSKEASDG